MSDTNNNTNNTANTTKLPHGGDWAGFELEYGKEPLDYSMNVNPLGMSMHVRYAISKAAAKADRYPDPLCRELRAKLSAHESVPAEWIFCGNGAADIIFRLAQALVPAKLLVTAPTFSEYETAFSGCGWKVAHHYLKEANGFRLDETILEAIDKETNAVFLCEPNNPTGVTSNRALLCKILERCQETNTLLIIDECFNGFLDQPQEHTMIDQLAEHDRLVILKAFTKLYGMAGIRLGYCLCSNPKLIEALYAAGSPWNVSSLAQASGIAALDDPQHVRKGRDIIKAERPYLTEALRNLGIDPVYGEANYLFFRSGPEAPEGQQSLCEKLRSEGILIRDCSNYVGLSEGWYRIAVRTHKENQQLIEALGKR